MSRFEDRSQRGRQCRRSHKNPAAVRRLDIRVHPRQPSGLRTRQILPPQFRLPLKLRDQTHDPQRKPALSQSKEFVIRSEGCLKADIKAESVAKISFEEDILFNSFFLSFEAGWITFNLIEIQYENVDLKQLRCFWSSAGTK